jgi:hypothetical protein
LVVQDFAGPSAVFLNPLVPHHPYERFGGYYFQTHPWPPWPISCFLRLWRENLGWS